MGPVACLLWVARCRSRWDHRPPLSSEGRASDAIGTKTQLQDFVRKSPDPRSDWIFSRFTRPFSCNPYKKKSGVGGWAGSLFWVTVMDTCPYWQLTEPLVRLIKSLEDCMQPACLCVVTCTKLMWLLGVLCQNHSLKSGVYWSASGLLMWGKVNLREIKKLVQGYRACVRSRIKKSDHHISKPTVWQLDESLDIHILSIYWHLLK